MHINRAEVKPVNWTPPSYICKRGGIFVKKNFYG